MRPFGVRFRCFSVGCLSLDCAVLKMACDLIEVRIGLLSGRAYLKHYDVKGEPTVDVRGLRFLRVQLTDSKLCGEIISRRILGKRNIQQGGHLLQKPVIPGRKLSVSPHPIISVISLRKRMFEGIRGDIPCNREDSPWTVVEIQIRDRIPDISPLLFDAVFWICFKIRSFGHVMDDEHCALGRDRGGVYFHPDPVYGIDLLIGR